MNAYKVKEGIVTFLESSAVFEFAESCDWINEVLVISESPEEAANLASDYDQGNIDGDNVFYPDCYGIILKAITRGQR